MVNLYNNVLYDNVHKKCLAAPPCRAGGALHHDVEVRLAGLVACCLCDCVFVCVCCLCLLVA